MACFLIVNRLPEGKPKREKELHLSLSLSGHCGKLVPSWSRCLWWERFGLRIDCRYITACLGAVACLGCQTNHKLTSSLEKPLKGKNPHSSKAAGTSEDFLTTSTYEMEDNTVESRGSISPISKLTKMHDAPGAGYSSNPSDFINHGLLLSYRIRQKWIENKKPVKHPQQLLEPRIHWNATYDSLLGSNKRFSKPVLLGEMVDFLVDIWEQEGMYD